MKKKDFKNTEEVVSSKSNEFCECCLSINPDTDEGYTDCCNECVVDQSTAIKLAKQKDVIDYLSDKFKCSTCGDLRVSNTATIELINKKKKFDINFRLSIEDVIDAVKFNTKGLRTDF